MNEVIHTEDDSCRDQALIEAWRRGDECALEMLLRHYQNRVFSFLYRMLNNRHDAEDAGQETFIRAAKHLNRYDARKGTFKTWLFSIAYREGARLATRRARHASGEQEDFGGARFQSDVADPAPDPACEMAYREKTALVANAIAGLPDAERRVVLLRTESQLRFREIAELMNAPLNTTLARMRRATLHLQRWFEEQAIGL